MTEEKMRDMLVIDDELWYCQLFKDFFSARGFRVDTAGDGKTGAVLLKKKRYDLIFIDCNMPEMSGIELIRILDKMPEQGKRVMISGYDLIDEEFAQNLRVDAFLRKPFKIKEVQKIVN